MPIKDNAKLLIMKTDDVSFVKKGETGYVGTYESFGQIKKGELKISFEDNKSIEFLDGSELSTGLKFKLEMTAMQYFDLSKLKLLNGELVSLKITGYRQGQTGLFSIYLKDVPLKVRLSQLQAFSEGDTTIAVSATKDVQDESEVICLSDPVTAGGEIVVTLSEDKATTYEYKTWNASATPPAYATWVTGGLINQFSVNLPALQKTTKSYMLLNGSWMEIIASAYDKVVGKYTYASPSTPFQIGDQVKIVTAAEAEAGNGVDPGTGGEA